MGCVREAPKFQAPAAAEQLSQRSTLEAGAAAQGYLRKVGGFGNGVGHALIAAQLLLPATSQRPVKLHEALVFVAARLGEGKFCGKQRALAVQNF